MVKKKLTDIAAIASPSNPWKQDPEDNRFFSIKLNRPWTKKDKYYEKNPSTGLLQPLVFDPGFAGKRQKGESISEDAIGTSTDKLTLWRFSANSVPTLSVDDMGYEEKADWDGWFKSDGWTNGSPFAVGWASDSVVVDDNDVVALSITNKPASSTPYSAGEFRTIDKYGYGRYEMTFKASDIPGTMMGFFHYTGPSEGTPHDEIDIEFAGSNPRQLRTTYWTNGKPTQSYLPLPFDASVDFHTYAFEWKPDRINWYVDGQLFHTETGSRGALPTHPGKIMVNFWAGDTGAASWLGTFNYTQPVFTYFKNPVLVAA